MAAPSVPVSFNYDQKTIRVAELGAVLSRSDQAGATALDPTGTRTHTHRRFIAQNIGCPFRNITPRAVSMLAR